MPLLGLALEGRTFNSPGYSEAKPRVVRGMDIKPRRGVISIYNILLRPFGA
jgi:hypothetical protein